MQALTGRLKDGAAKGGMAFDRVILRMTDPSILPDWKFAYAPSGAPTYMADWLKSMAAWDGQIFVLPCIGGCLDCCGDRWHYQSTSTPDLVQVADLVGKINTWAKANGGHAVDGIVFEHQSAHVSATDAYSQLQRATGGMNPLPLLICAPQSAPGPDLGDWDEFIVQVYNWVTGTGDTPRMTDWAGGACGKDAALASVCGPQGFLQTAGGSSTAAMAQGKSNVCMYVDALSTTVPCPTNTHASGKGSPMPPVGQSVYVLAQKALGPAAAPAALAAYVRYFLLGKADGSLATNWVGTGGSSKPVTLMFSLEARSKGGHLDAFGTEGWDATGVSAFMRALHKLVANSDPSAGRRMALFDWSKVDMAWWD